MPDGDELWPRAEFCADVLSITDRTARNLGLPSVLIGGFAYVPYKKSLAVIASRIRHAPEPPKPRGRTRNGHGRGRAGASAMRAKG